MSPADARDAWPQGSDRPPDLATLTGVRSGKRSYYREFRRSSARLEAAVSSLDGISLALVRTEEGPRKLLTAVLIAAAQHLQARWVLLAVTDGALPGARPRFLAMDAAGRVLERAEDLPGPARACLQLLRTSAPSSPAVGDGDLVLVPMTIDGETVGGIAALSGLPNRPEPVDLSVLRILVNQAAVALHNALLHHTGLALADRAEHLTAEASQHARDLAERSQELQSAQELLDAARDRETLHAERHRIARELHDTVTQYVLSAGMAVEVARSEIARFGPELSGVAERLEAAKGLTQHAVEQLRAAIYALHHTSHDTTPALPRLLEQACAGQNRPGLAVELRLEGSPVALPAAAEQSLGRVAGQALFNVSAHSGAGRCAVRLSYRSHQIALTVDDDGTGDPAALRTMLRVEAAGDVDGRHRGLVNMASRVEELGGSFRVLRSRLGGVRTEVKVPLPPKDNVRSPENRSDQEDAP